MSFVLYYYIMRQIKMIRKIIGVALCLLFIVSYAPVLAAEQNQYGTYEKCFIESSGTIINRLALGLFKLRNLAFIIYLNIDYIEDGETSIYDYETGNMLWHQKGEHNILFLFYLGDYSYIKNQDGSIFIALKGITLIAQVYY